MSTSSSSGAPRPWEAPAVVEEHAGLLVVRDDLLPGGSKTRFLPTLLRGADEVVYATPFCGGAQLALAVVGQALGIRVTLFCAERKTPHPWQAEAVRRGASYRTVYKGRMNVLEARARDYAERRGALRLPMGFDVFEAEAVFCEAMGDVRERYGDPPEVWCATGSGMLARCLGLAFPESSVRTVAVGGGRWRRARLPENVSVREYGRPFAEECPIRAPFPSAAHYDRKAWAIAAREAPPGSLFWNVAG